MANILDFAVKIDTIMHNGFSDKLPIMLKSFDKLQQAQERLQSQSRDISGLQKMQGALHSSQSSLETLRAQMTRNASKLSEARANTSRLSDEYSKAQRRVAEYSRTMKPHSMLLIVAKKQAQELGQQYRASAKETQTLEQTHAKLYAAIGRGEANVDAQKRSLDEMSQALNRAGVNSRDLAAEQDKLAQASQRLEHARSRLNSIKDTLSWGNIKSTALGAVATYSVLKAPIKIAGDFEAAMQKVKAVGFSTPGADLEKFEQLRAQSLELGATTKFTSIEAAAAQEALIRANFDPDQVLQTMPALLNTAAAENLGIDQAADIIAGVMGGLHMKANESNKIADMLAFTSATSKTNIPFIAEALKSVMPVAYQNDIKLGQLLSYIGILANGQMDASSISTGLRNAIQLMASDNVQKTMENFGIKTKTKNGDLVELPEILAQLDKKLSKYGSVDRTNILTKMFGQRTSSIIGALMTSSASGDIDAYYNRIREGYEGQSKRMADINLDSLNGQLTILSSSWDGLKTAIGDLFKDEVRIGVEWLSGALSKVTETLKAFPPLSKAAAWGLATLASYKTIKGIWGIGSAILQLPGAWLEVQRATKNAADAVGGVSGAVNSLGKTGGVFSSLYALAAAHPFAAIAVAIGGIVTVSVLVYQNWEKIKELWNELDIWAKNFKMPQIDRSVPVSSMQKDTADYHIRNMESIYQIPEIKQHATGGIFTREHFGVVAEAGPEAIIPLKDKSRGLSLLSKVSDILGVTPHAKGGIFSQPHVGLIGEAGSEAIIPLKNKSRGIPLLLQAADILLPQNSTQSSQNFIAKSNSLQEGIIDYGRTIYNSVDTNNAGSNINSNSISGLTFNINVSGGNDNQEALAEKIARAVRNVLDNLADYEERIAYA